MDTNNEPVRISIKPEIFDELRTAVSELEAGHKKWVEGKTFYPVLEVAFLFEDVKSKYKELREIFRNQHRGFTTLTR